VEWAARSFALVAAYPDGQVTEERVSFSVVGEPAIMVESGRRRRVLVSCVDREVKDAADSVE